MIKIREYLLDIFFGTLKKDVLNAAATDAEVNPELPVVIAETMLALKNQAIISDGGVNYHKLKTSAAFQRLQAVIYPGLAAFNPALLSTPEEKLAFWINLYNLLTIDGVLHYAVRKSVTEGWLGVIRFFRKTAYCVGGLRFNLEDIEHGILRANHGIPWLPGRHFSKSDRRRQSAAGKLNSRIHFALNCASRSCPPIACFSANRINEQLDLAVANFIDSETLMDKSGVVLHISRIFKWYAQDFGGKIGVLEFLKRYLPTGDMRKKLIEDFDYQTMLIYRPYDWKLNVLS